MIHFFHSVIFYRNGQSLVTEINDQKTIENVPQVKPTSKRLLSFFKNSLKIS